MAVGVPLIAPVVASRDRPVGSDGETDHDVIVPPLTVGVTVVICVPIVSTNEFGLYAKVDGATSFTSMVIVAVSVPPVLVAVIV
jgi:hypothetical protein